MRELGTLLTKVESFAPTLQEFTYVDLGSVEAATKRIVNPRVISIADAPSRARQRLKAGDVLVSTVRPNLNGVACVPEELDGAIGSTGFAVLRADPELLDFRYLFYWVTSPKFIESMVRVATGASYPAVSDATVKASKIPLPSLPEQRRIASILDQAAKSIRARELAIHELDRWLELEFQDLFGDVVANEKGWDVGSVTDYVTSFGSGKSVVGSESSLRGNEPRVLKISAVTSGRFDPGASKPLPNGYTPPAAHFVCQSDLLMSRANTAELVGAVALVREPPHGLVLPDKLWRFNLVNPSLANSMFLWKLFGRPEVRRELSGRATGSGGSMKNLAMGSVLSMPIVRPPEEMIANFADLVVASEALRLRQSTNLDLLNELFGSLQSRAFAGQL